MRLILQCAVCGTVNNVGLTTCGTCRATGLESLRLLFECLHCFRVGLTPTCEICSKLLPLDPPYEVVPEPVDPDELARRWGVDDEPEPVVAKFASDEPLDPAWVEELPEVDVRPIEDEVATDKERIDEVEATVEDDASRREPSG